MRCRSTFIIQVPKSERSGWFTPVIFYLSAAVQLVLPFSEWSIRIPSVIVGLTNLVLLFVLGRRLFGNTWIALMSAALLALSPAHYIFSRYALDYLYPVPFLLAWLIALHSRDAAADAASPGGRAGFASVSVSTATPPRWC